MITVSSNLATNVLIEKLGVDRIRGTVASLGAVGTIASVDLRRHHPDLREATAHAAKAEVDAANLTALDREIVAARALAAGRGMVAVNVMRAVSEYPRYVKQAIGKGEVSAVVYEHLGDIYYRMNQKDLAMEQWQMALKLDEANSALRDKIARGSL